MKGWYENGQQEYEYTYILGNRSGVRTKWYKNGQLKSIENYDINSKPHGNHRYFYENKRLESETPYTNGLVHGIITEWSFDGTIVNKYLYVYGLKSCSRSRN